MAESETIRMTRPGTPGVGDTATDIPGRIGSVRLVRELARGGMGIVWLGRDELLGRDVAVKFLLGDVAAPDDPEFGTFLEGARAAAALAHPGLTAVYAAGLVHGVPYIVMEYIPGPTLGRIMLERGPLSVDAALTALEAVCAAVAVLHDEGIVHRDIKPANVMTEPGGRIAITDFGLACWRSLGGAAAIRIAGTPAYMAPEMWDGQINARTDVYALGILALELLTGRQPFSGNAEQLRAAHSQSPPPLADLEGKGIPPQVIQVIERCLLKDATFRFKTAGHLLRALEAARDPQARERGQAELATLLAGGGEAAAADPAAAPQSSYGFLSFHAARRRAGAAPAPERSPGLSGIVSRDRLIKVLLYALALAAISGVLAVFLTDRQLILRVTGMGFITAVCAGMMLPLSLLVDGARFRLVGLVGMALCTAEFLVAIVLVWSELGWHSLDEQLALTLLFLPLTGVPAMGCIALGALRGGRAAARLGVAMASLTLIAYLLAVWINMNFTGFARPGLRVQLLETANALGGTSIPAGLALIGLGASRHRRLWRMVGIIASAGALVMLLYSTWVEAGSDASSLVCVLSVALFVAYTNLALLVPLRAAQRWVCYGAIAAAAATALFIDLDTCFQPANSDPYGFERFATGAGIITASGTLALLILGRLNRSPDYDPLEGPPRQISLFCPRCRKKQTLPVGDAACSGCKLRIHTRIELPLCPTCGYDTSTLAGDKCPECGTVILAASGATA